jgi:hypothetical protein
MKQQLLPLKIPVTKKLSSHKKKAALKSRYQDILHSNNEDYFYTQLEELKRAINGQ